jgi:hypothetical protein
MYTYGQIAIALRKVNYLSCTASTLSYLGFLSRTNVDDKGFITAHLYTNVNYSRMFNGYAMEETLLFLNVSYEKGNDDPEGHRFGEYLKYNVCSFFAALKAKTGIDVAEAIIDHRAKRELAMQLKAQRDRDYAKEAAKITPDRLFYDDLLAADDIQDSYYRKEAKGRALSELMYRVKYRYDVNVIPFYTLLKLVTAATEQAFLK